MRNNFEPRRGTSSLTVELGRAVAAGAIYMLLNKVASIWYTKSGGEAEGSIRARGLHALRRIVHLRADPVKNRIRRVCRIDQLSGKTSLSLTFWLILVSNGRNML